MKTAFPRRSSRRRELSSAPARLPRRWRSSSDDKAGRETTAAPASARPAAIEPPDADALAPGKRHIDLTASPQAEPSKRARTSEYKAAPAPVEDERPTEAEPQDDEAAPQSNARRWFAVRKAQGTKMALGAAATLQLTGFLGSPRVWVLS